MRNVVTSSSPAIVQAYETECNGQARPGQARPGQADKSASPPRLSLFPCQQAFSSLSLSLSLSWPPSMLFFVVSFLPVCVKGREGRRKEQFCDEEWLQQEEERAS